MRRPRRPRARWRRPGVLTRYEKIEGTESRSLIGQDEQEGNSGTGHFCRRRCDAANSVGSVMIFRIIGLMIMMVIRPMTMLVDKADLL